MKRAIITLFIFFVGFSFIKAQLITKAKIENVNTQIVDDKIEVNFSITHTSKNENVKVQLKFQKGDSFIYPKSIIGATEAISEGKHTIIWDVLKDVEELEGEIKPMITIIETNSKLKAKNAFIPGFNSGNKIIATVSYACFIGGIIQLLSANNYYNSYKNEMDNSVLRRDYYNKAVDIKSRSMILFGAGAGLLATNIILTRVYNKKYNFAAIKYCNNGICLSYVHTFHL